MDAPWWVKALVVLVVLCIVAFFVYAIWQNEQAVHERAHACLWAGYGQTVYITDGWFCIRGIEGGGMEAMPVWPGILLDYRAREGESIEH